ncbi:hypothetical protein BJ170DRAFT_455285 [Xylariales sp. AK1849]|nr:hypothetical protein BJ170DRAFT_455285 [Xylariales sp. AK1849]
MPFKQHHAPSFPPDTPMDNQLPPSPLDADFPPTPMDLCFPEDSAALSPLVSFASEPATPFSPQPIPVISTQPTCYTSTPAFPASSSSSSVLSPAPPAAFSAHRTARQARTNPAFADKLQQMALPLAPLVQLTTGLTHPSFPSTLLNFWLLTEAELESLAHFYHQRTPCRWTAHYPCPVLWDSRTGLEEKRRKIGRFIGLRGCDTPAGTDRMVRETSEEQVVEEARRAREREDEDEVWRRKLTWY